jgi:hypothetical protein
MSYHVRINFSFFDLDFCKLEAGIFDSVLNDDFKTFDDKLLASASPLGVPSIRGRSLFKYAARPTLIHLILQFHQF